MKTQLAYLAFVLYMLGALIQVHAQGYIVPNGVTFNGFDGVGYSVFVTQNPSTGDYTGFDLNPVGETPPSSPYVNTYLFNPIVDEGVRTFIVSANDAISLQPIMAGSYAELTYPNSYVFANGSTFYLGLYTGYNPWDSHGNYTGIYTNPLFGWGRFRNNNGVIEMLSSALEYGGGGIFAGTQTIIPVPEPSAFALLGLSALLFGFRRGMT
jgi:hypothetical protein